MIKKINIFLDKINKWVYNVFNKLRKGLEKMRATLKDFFSIEDTNFRKAEKEHLKEQLRIEEYKTGTLI